MKEHERRATVRLRCPEPHRPAVPQMSTAMRLEFDTIIDNCHDCIFGWESMKGSPCDPAYCGIQYMKQRKRIRSVPAFFHGWTFSIDRGKCSPEQIQKSRTAVCKNQKHGTKTQKAAYSTYWRSTRRQGRTSGTQEAQQKSAWSTERAVLSHQGCILVLGRSSSVYWPNVP
ncbi:hypothetical protein BDW22DRAFT_1110078 [Trametopsis cervina]|nr:hypothetical protein BDW22DRAFT_1110078 [Trametopsis cervina]